MSYLCNVDHGDEMWKREEVDSPRCYTHPEVPSGTHQAPHPSVGP